MRSFAKQMQICWRGRCFMEDTRVRWVCEYQSGKTRLGIVVYILYCPIFFFGWFLKARARSFPNFYCNIYLFGCCRHLQYVSARSRSTPAISPRPSPARLLPPVIQNRGFNRCDGVGASSGKVCAGMPDNDRGRFVTICCSTRIPLRRLLLVARRTHL